MSTTKDNRFYRTKPAPKTVIIWDEVQAQIQFVVIDRDVSHLNGVYINGDDDEKSQELSDLLCLGDGECPIDFLDNFPVDAVKDGAKVIVAGFLP